VDETLTMVHTADSMLGVFEKHISNTHKTLLLLATSYDRGGSLAAKSWLPRDSRANFEFLVSKRQIFVMKQSWEVDDPNPTMWNSGAK